MLQNTNNICRGCENGTPVPLCVRCILFLEENGGHDGASDQTMFSRFLQRITAAGRFDESEPVCRACTDGSVPYCLGCLGLLNHSSAFSQLGD